ncbi:MAG: hypothetical protein LH702_31185 [Phormidesmis sp. CAN_BIN44]|nr:hypothetical protein [Phormidesmis sp. CAN_BIN44]
MEPTEDQYLVLNALETLGFIERRLYDPEIGVWCIETVSPILAIAFVLADGEIVPIYWLQDP